jgi:hypothetical protein
MITQSGPTVEEEISEAMRSKLARAVFLGPGRVRTLSGKIVTYCLCEEEGPEHPECPKHGGRNG